MSEKSATTRDGNGSLPDRTDIVGELHVASTHYWIVLLERSRRDRQKMHASHSPHSIISYKEIERFEIGGQLCAVVQPESNETGKLDDITKLLTARELQIATLVAMGRLNKQVAHQLHISEWTVAAHLRRTFAKLGVDTRAAMVYRCASLIGCLRESEIDQI